MKTCPNCQSGNGDTTNFCIKCGADLRNLSAQPSSVPASVPADSTPPAPVPSETTGIETVSSMTTAPSATPPANAAPSPGPASGYINADAAPKKKRFSFKAVIGVVVALVIVIFALSAIITASNPAKRLIDGFEKISRNSAQTVDSTVTVKYKGDNDQLKLMNSASIKMSSAVDTNKMLAESSFEVLYDNKSVAKFSAGLAAEDVFLDPLKLYTKKFYYQLDDQTLSTIDELQVLFKYLKQVDVQFNSGKYAKVIKETLGDNISGSLGKATFTLDAKTSVELIAAILKEAQDDKQLMESIRKNGQSVINKILNDNHTFEVLFDESVLEDALPYFENKGDFTDLYQAGIDSAVSSLEEALTNMKDSPEYYASVPDMDFTVTFGLFNNIKSVSCTMAVKDPNTDESYNVVVDSKIKSGARFTNFKRSGATDVLDVANDPAQLQTIGEKVVKNLITNIKSNKKLTTAIEDLTGQDINDLDSYIMGDLLPF